MAIQINQTYYSSIFLVVDQNGVPVTNLTSADFNRTAYHNGASDPISITVNHLQNGKYQAQFTPDKAGTWVLIVSQPTYAPFGWAERIFVAITDEVPAVGDVYFGGIIMVFDQNGQPVTSLVDVDFNKSLFFNGASDPATVSVTHLENGKYQAYFTPDKAGIWSIIITQPTYDAMGWSEQVFIGRADVLPATFSDVELIRILSQFDNINFVPDNVIDYRRVQAYNLIYRYLKPEYKTKVDDGTLTPEEIWDFRFGEAELAISFLCKSLASKFTLYKFNRSIASGIGGGQSDRDSRKNLDFRIIKSDWWEQAWGILADYVVSVPRIGDEGGIDPYSIFNFSAVENEDLESFSEEEESLEVNWG